MTATLKWLILGPIRPDFQIATGGKKLKIGQKAWGTHLLWLNDYAL